MTTIDCSPKLYYIIMIETHIICGSHWCIIILKTFKLYYIIIVETHIDVWQPEELRTLCHSSGVSFPCGWSRNWRAFGIKKIEKVFFLSNKAKDGKSLQCTLGWIESSFLLLACLFWPALRESKLIVNLVLESFSLKNVFFYILITNLIWFSGILLLLFFTGIFL